MKFLRLLFVATFMLAVAMPTHAGRMAKSKLPLVAEPNMATVVFMRPGKFVGRAIGVPVYDVTDEEIKFVGIADPGAKMAYSVSPGEHTFMTTVFAGDAGVRFYKANVEAGKIYYYRVHIINNLWGMHPVRGSDLEGDEFSKWDGATELTENSPKTLAWATENQLEAERKSGLEPKVISDEFSLGVEDGR